MLRQPWEAAQRQHGCRAPRGQRTRSRRRCRPRVAPVAAAARRLCRWQRRLQLPPPQQQGPRSRCSRSLASPALCPACRSRWALWRSMRQPCRPPLLSMWWQPAPRGSRRRPAASQRSSRLGCETARRWVGGCTAQVGRSAAPAPPPPLTACRGANMQSLRADATPCRRWRSVAPPAPRLVRCCWALPPFRRISSRASR